MSCVDRSAYSNTVLTQSIAVSNALGSEKVSIASR